jgi:hypothetical protein
VVLSRAAPCRHLANTLEWKAQRCALLFGAVDTAKKTITVEAIYEPPQKDADNAAYDASNLVLRGPKAADSPIERVAVRLPVSRAPSGILRGDAAPISRSAGDARLATRRLDLLARGRTRRYSALGARRRRRCAASRAHLDEVTL